ncbi:MAG: ABC transporter ATP-binding protein [Phycisphaerales bacterium]
MSEPILHAAALCKTYRLGRIAVPVLKGVSMSAGRGECVAILGASGSGKSTLLHLLGGLDTPDRSADGRPAGEVRFEGNPIGGFSSSALDRYRSLSVGFVFQFYHLLPELSVLQNVTVAAMIRYGRFGYLRARGEVESRAKDLLGAFGLSHRLRHRPAELSGGERPRVAIARALCNQPRVLLADEPTGNLDRTTGGAILELLFERRRVEGLTMVMVTHDPEVAARADRVVRLVDGVVAAGAG